MGTGRADDFDGGDPNGAKLTEVSNVSRLHPSHVKAQGERDAPPGEGESGLGLEGAGPPQWVPSIVRKSFKLQSLRVSAREMHLD